MFWKKIFNLIESSNNLINSSSDRCEHKSEGYIGHDTSYGVSDM